MKIIHRNGRQFNIYPKRWWNIFDWLWVLENAENIQSQTGFNMNGTEVLTFTRGYVTK